MAAHAAETTQAVEPIKVGINCDAPSAAKALVEKLRAHNGSAQVWATGISNQYQALSVLARAQQMLELDGQSLHAICQRLQPDFELDEQKRSMKKVVWDVHQIPHDPEGSAGNMQRVSANRAQNYKELLEAISTSLASPGMAVIVEARGERAVTRALKSVMSVQAVLGHPVLMTPARGPVVDVSAQKRGEAKTAAGMILILQAAPIPAQDDMHTAANVSQVRVH
eukprot:jgi/Chrzof1/1068/Cz01g39010.t1